MTDEHRWTFGTFDRALGRFPLLMGIVNVTPDSFSDGGRFESVDAAVRHAEGLVEDGADILDVGGESTRPGAEPVAADQEVQRVVPVIERLSGRVAVPISIDTTKTEVARRAIDAGASIVNDISGLTFDAAMPELCAREDVGVVCMHIKGTPQTMQDDLHYHDVVSEVCEHLKNRVDDLQQCGIDRDRIVVDPGIGFGKTAKHNLDLLRNVDRLRRLGRPVLIGHSRKRFLGRVTGRKIDERVAGTIGVSIALAARSTDIMRVHDVRAVRDALRAWQALS